MRYVTPLVALVGALAAVACTHVESPSKVKFGGADVVGNGIHPRSRLVATCTATAPALTVELYQYQDPHGQYSAASPYDVVIGKPGQTAAQKTYFAAQQTAADGALHLVGTKYPTSSFADAEGVGTLIVGGGPETTVDCPPVAGGA